MAQSLPVTVPAPPLPPALHAGLEAACEFAQRKRAVSTRAGYAADFRLFADWCRASGLEALPASSAAVATYVAIEARRGIRPATLGRRIAAIQFMHREAGHPSPADNQHVRDVMAGIRNTVGTAPGGSRRPPPTVSPPCSPPFRPIP